MKNLTTPGHAFLDLFELIVETNNVKDAFCQIQAGGGNIHVGFSSLLVDGKFFFLHPGALTPFSEAGRDHLISGSRPARRHTFVRQQKYAKVPAPCGGHLLCLISEGSKHDTAQEAGPLPGGLPFSAIYKGKAKNITIVASLHKRRGSQEPRLLRGKCRNLVA